MKIEEKIKCKKSFQQGIAYASALVMEMCVNCVHEDDTHEKILKAVSRRIVDKATLAYQRGDVTFEGEE